MIFIGWKQQILIQKDRQITNDKHFGFKIKQKFFMKRERISRKKKYRPPHYNTLHKHPKNTRPNKTYPFKRSTLHSHQPHLTQPSQPTTSDSHSTDEKISQSTKQNSSNTEISAQVQHYTSEIISYLSKVDEEFQTKNQNQQGTFPCSEVNLSMRKILLKWLHKFAAIFKLKQETLHICIQLIDCTLIRSSNTIKKSNFQLLGVTCLFMASKLVQIIAPQAKRFVDACDGLYTLSELFSMQQFVLSVMSFELQVPTIHEFMSIFIEEENPSTENEELLRYLSELCLYEFPLLNGYKKTTVTGAIVYLWGKITKNEGLRSSYLMQKYSISLEMFEKCLREVMKAYKKSYLVSQFPFALHTN